MAYARWMDAGYPIGWTISILLLGSIYFLVVTPIGVVMRLVGRVIALDFGEVIAQGSPEDIVRHPAVVEAYIGRDATGTEGLHAA